MNVTIKTLKKHFPSFDAGKNGDDVVFYTHAKIDFKFAHKIIRLDYTGWFTNEHGETCIDGSGLCRGIVATLPEMPGFPNGRFLAGYLCGDNGGSVLWPEMYADIEDAARDADSHAESFAEMCREDDAKFSAVRDIEDSIEEKQKRLVECLALRHKKCMGYVRTEISAICASLRELTQKRAELGDF